VLKQQGRNITDRRWQCPAAERNKAPILDVLRRVLPNKGSVLEVASGTGQHVMYFADALPGLAWQPSDPDPELRELITARLHGVSLDNVEVPVDLDVLSTPWPVTRADAVICINMLHVAPWQATVALLRGAANTLPVLGILFLYGPYRRSGVPTASSNRAFDDELRARNPEWGIRDLDAVVELAAQTGLGLDEVVEMPANNLSVIFSKHA